jgi:hypothetical protein
MARQNRRDIFIPKKLAVLMPFRRLFVGLGSVRYLTSQRSHFAIVLIR